MANRFVQAAVVATGLCTGAFAQGVPTSEQDAVLAPVQALFDAMARHDAAASKAVWLPEATLVLMRDGKPVRMTADAFAEHVGKPSPVPVLERIHNPVVRVDRDLAVVWAPFEYLSGGKLDHCGTDLFTLVKLGEQWLIASVADTSVKPCPAGN